MRESMVRTSGGEEGAENQHSRRGRSDWMETARRQQGFQVLPAGHPFLCSLSLPLYQLAHASPFVFPARAISHPHWLPVPFLFPLSSQSSAKTSLSLPLSQLACCWMGHERARCRCTISHNPPTPLSQFCSIHV